jgi:hypothetical protein
MSERTWHVGPPDEPYWKFRVAQLAYRFASWRVVSELPGAEAVRNWAFGVTVLSRDFDEVETTERNNA